MRIMKFLSTTTLSNGEGQQPSIYEAGKAYWLYGDRANHVEDSGAAVENMDAAPENERPLPRRSNTTIRAGRVADHPGDTLRNIVVMGAVVRGPLPRAEAERQIAAMIAGRMDIPDAAVGLVAVSPAQAARMSASPAAIAAAAPPPAAVEQPAPPAAIIEPPPEPVIPPPADEQKPVEDAGLATIKHAGRGRFNVLNGAGEVVTSDPMSKDDAEALAGQLNAGRSQ